jgi:hypothetical protein
MVKYWPVGHLILDFDFLVLLKPKNYARKS